MAVREGDIRMMCFHPHTQGLEKFHKLMIRGMDSPAIGSQLVSLALQAGIPRSNITASMGAWCYSSPEERKVWGSSMASRARNGKQREKPVEEGWATYAEMDEMVEAWEEWIKAEDGLFGIMNGEVLIQKPLEGSQ